MTSEATIRTLRREAVMRNRTSLWLGETSIAFSEARTVAARIGWSFSHTAGLDEFYTDVRPVYWVLMTSTGERIYLDGDEASRFMAQTGRCGEQTVEIARDGQWRAACWSGGDILLSRDGKLDSVVRMSDAQIIVRA